MLLCTAPPYHQILPCGVLKIVIIFGRLNKERPNESVTVESLSTDPVKTPDPLRYFFHMLYTGSESPVHDQVDRHIQSVCDDVMFVTSSGRIKPSKHVLIGSGMKNITGSRRVIEILNRFGHSVIYHTVEALETDLATEITERKQTTPDSILKQAGLSTGLAWYNYDGNNETLTGSGTLQDTVGICYQNQIDSQPDDGTEGPKTEETEIQNDHVNPETITRTGTGRLYVRRSMGFCVHMKRRTPASSITYTIFFRKIALLSIVIRSYDTLSRFQI